MPLDGLSLHRDDACTGPMGAGNMTVGLIIDERASDAQVEAISAIATGAVGGPMAALGPLVGKIAGVERRPIQFDMRRPEPGGACRRPGGPGLRRHPQRQRAWPGDWRRQHRAPGEQPTVAGQGDCAACSTSSASSGTTRPARATATSRPSPGPAELQRESAIRSASVSPSRNAGLNPAARWRRRPQWPQRCRCSAR